MLLSRARVPPGMRLVLVLFCLNKLLSTSNYFTSSAAATAAAIHALEIYSCMRTEDVYEAPGLLYFKVSSTIYHLLSKSSPLSLASPEQVTESDLDNEYARLGGTTTKG